MAPWIQVRQDLYKQLRNQVSFLEGAEDAELRRYREAFERGLEAAWKPISNAGFFADLARADLILLGDFHALQQSQKSHLRILRSVPQRRERILALECLRASDQESIDAFMEGRMEEDEFLEAVDWRNSWGFPWEHHRPLLKYAQKHRLRVLGINTKDQMPLKQRDRFAAETLCKALSERPGVQVFVVIGDLHLAEGHLPKSIDRVKPRSLPLEIASVVQSPEKAYFRLLARDEEMHVDVIQFARGLYGVMTMPPWVKWQNYLMFLEHSLDKDLHSEPSELTDVLVRFVQLLSHDLGVKINTDHLAVYTAEDPHFWDLLAKGLDRTLLQQYRRRIEMSQSFYVPESQYVYLARTTVNHAAQAAMSVVHAQLSGWKISPRLNADGFLRLIWLELIQYFGTKLINPKRKTETLLDLRTSLASRTSREQEREALQLALHQRMKEVLLLVGGRERSPSFRPRRASSYAEASRLLGGVLGERLYFGYRRKRISQELLLKLLRSPVDSPDFSTFYYEFIEVVEGLPEPFLSKTEKI